MDSTKCFICGAEVAESARRIVKSLGLETLIQASKKRKDGKHVQFKAETEIVVHKSCQTKYVLPSNIKKAAEEHAQAGPSTRSAPPASFDFGNLCFICGEDASDNFINKQAKNRHESRVVVGFVVNNSIRSKIVNFCEKTPTLYAESVLSRIISTPDLSEVGARYHRNCYKNLYNYQSESIRGRPLNPSFSAAESFVIDYILNNSDECQFSLSSILQQFSSTSEFLECPSLQYMKKRLQLHFDSDILFFSYKKDIYMCFRDTGAEILTKNWYENKLKNKEEERQRIVKTAASIILEDIRSKFYATDNYNAPDSFLDNINDDIPKSLQIFLDSLIKTNKKSNEMKWMHTITTFAHCIISSVRPRSFLSSVLIGLSAMIHKKHASKGLINALSFLGLCASYDETQLFEASILHDPQQYDFEDTFLQFSYDNADHNTCTIDGFNTFHSMGGIMCATPHSSVTSSRKIKRLKKVPSSDVIGKFGYLPVKTFEKKQSLGLKKILIDDLSDKSNIDIDQIDFLWLFAKKINPETTRGWNGYMEEAFKNKQFSQTKIIPLPFVNDLPSKYDTIYTVLLQAAEKCKLSGQKQTFVTFDQPLYVKAKEILACRTDDTNNELNCIILRLGGFHTLMSFMGTVGYLMNGSGLKELLSEIYASASVDHILTGHAYARAVRAHILCSSALATFIFSSTDFTAEETEYLEQLVNDISTESSNEGTLNNINTGHFETIKNKFISKLENLKKNGPTSELWIQYFRMITLVKQFIAAERSGQWQLHLQCVQRMLPYFHASGHFLYAKSAHMYLQDMLQLEKKMDVFEYDKFMNRGFFTIRRTNKFWSGVWSDMAIEQALMKEIKTFGGLTHGRGLTESVIAKWILSAIVLLDVTKSIGDFCNVNYVTSEQHIDSRSSRISKDNTDLKKLIEFFNIHNPFPKTKFIMSIASGLKGDEYINCYKALEEGNLSLQSIVGKTFGDVKFERKKKVLALNSMSSSVKVGDDILAIDPTLLFQRISLQIKAQEDMQDFLKYELAPYPLTLFDEVGMRKTPKSQFIQNFKNLLDDSLFKLDFLQDAVYVIDGGFLLHRVVWNKNDSVSFILQKYVNYIKSHYSKNTTIVFDGYPDTANTLHTKSAERIRRSKKEQGREIIFDKSMNINMLQNKFLSNDRNKKRLIQFLSAELVEAGYFVKQSEEDADVLIIKTAIELTKENNITIIVGEDTDLLVIFTQLAYPLGLNNIYFNIPSKSNVPEKIFSIDSFKPQCKDLVCFLHAFCGCDTTSAFYQIGKNKIVSIIENDCNLQNLARSFNTSSTETVIAENTEKIILALYGKKHNKKQLSELRYFLFKKLAANKSFKLEKLPPTKSVAAMHGYRVYHQVQLWLGNNLSATEWGWKSTVNGLQPIYSLENLIPTNLLESIFCRCEKGCKTAICSCRKHGLRCTDICLTCRGHSCSNVEKSDVSHLSISDDDEN